VAHLGLLERCKRKRRLEVDRYYQTVLLTIGLKDFFDNEKSTCRFVSAEPTFTEFTSGKEVFPDVVLQHDNDTQGIICEIKTSLPEVDFFLLEKLKQLELFSGQVEGWEANNRKVNDHSLILLCHALDSDRVVEKINQWMNEGKLKITKKLCIAEWSTIESLKFDQRDVILVRHKSGETDCEWLNTKLRQNIKLGLEELITKYEKCRFTRKEPPLEYTMNQLWSCIFPAIREETEDFTSNIGEISRIAYDYFIPWSGIHGEYSQVRKRWITKAMNSFCEIDLAEKAQSEQESPGKVDEEYKIYYGKRIQKDVSDYFVEGLCQKRIEEAGKLPTEETLEEAQRRLAEFG
jgi:hypothetical protein